MIVVSRGGVKSWYQGLGARYIDLFDEMAPEQAASLHQKRWERDMRQKQIARDDDDDKVLAHLGQKMGIEDYEVLHPSLMFRLFWPGLHSRLPVESMLARTRYRRLDKPELEESLRRALPEDYVAVRFYFRPSFPDCPENRAFVAEMIQRISRTLPVVLLNTGLSLDDHTDCPANGSFSHRT